MNSVLIGCLGFLLGCGSDDVVGPAPASISIQANEQSQTTLQLTHDTYVSHQSRHGDCSPEWSIHGPVVCSSGEPGCFEPRRPLATDSLIVTNGLTGEVSFDVTADIAAILAQGYRDNPYVFGWLFQKPQHNESGDITFTSRDGVRAPRLILTTQESGPSPLAFPPDSFPSQYADSSNIVQTPACSGIRFLRHIILLTFKPGTTLAQREEALALVNGIVVGGRAVTEQHTYYIRVDDDEFGSGVCAATSNLESLAYVESASPSYEIELFYRPPVDAAG